MIIYRQKMYGLFPHHIVGKSWTKIARDKGLFHPEIIATYGDGSINNKTRAGADRSLKEIKEWIHQERYQHRGVPDSKKPPLKGGNIITYDDANQVAMKRLKANLKEGLDKDYGKGYSLRDALKARKQALRYIEDTNYNVFDPKHYSYK